MKKILRSFPFVVLLFAVAFFSSCSQFGNLDIQKRHYSKGFYVHRSEKHDAVSADEKTTTAAVTETSAEIRQPDAVAETNPVSVAQPSKTVAVHQQAAEESKQAARPAVEKPVTHTTTIVPVKTRKPASIVMHDRKAPVAPASGDVDLVLLVILALLLPPLAVFLKEGDLTMNFVIDLLLCLLFWIPGVVFALLVVFDVI